MKIIITGANGFLGNALYQQLKKTRHDILPVVRSKTDKILHTVCNIADATSLLDLLNKYKPNIIINCAAKVDFSDNLQQEQYKTNALAPSVMAAWAAENNAHLLQTSSSIVNGNTIEKFNNSSIENPISHYGHTKLLADNAIQLSQCKSAIIRFGGIFGAGGPSHLGINNAINQAKLGKTPTIVGKGSALRNYIHIQDAAKLLIHCMNNDITGIHYAGNHQSISIAQMLIDITNIYLNGNQPNYQTGEDSTDQITEISTALPQTMRFKNALEIYR